MSHGTNRQVKNLLDVSNDEKRNFLNSFDYVLTDCDGVIWTVIKPIEGAGEGITSLQENGKRVIFISNNSVRPHEKYVEKFKEGNINASMDDVLHPSIACVCYLRKINFKGLIYCIGSAEFKKKLKEAGYEYIDGPHEKIEDFATLWKAVKDDNPVKAVIIDSDFNVSSTILIRAEIYLKNPECLFIAGTTDMMLPITKSFKIIGVGPYYKILEEASGRRAVVVGKPGDALKDIVIDKYNIKDPKRVLFVGDTLEQDIGFGTKCGFKTVLVMTGSTSKMDILTHPKKQELPDYYLENIGDFSKVFEDIKVMNKI
ncbi:hypothetical protein HA402_002101 [Bradysia odoriphaga]|nr:hypothetical protein HA402_002101 [Bradysia odoriphaga]